MEKKYNCNRCKDKNWLVVCACGKCDDIITRFDKSYHERKYMAGHYHPKNPPHHKMEKHPQWKGGHYYSSISEYHYTRLSDHPYKTHGYVVNHRLVMEQYLKILFDEDVFIPREYYVNHINLNKQDNSLINLEIVTPGQHDDARRISLDMNDRRCATCHSMKTSTYKTKNLGLRGSWTKHPTIKGGWECMNCYMNRYRHKYK